LYISKKKVLEERDPKRIEKITAVNAVNFNTNNTKTPQKESSIINNRANVSTEPVTKGEMVVLLLHNGETIGVIDINKEQLLSDVRRKMREDEVCLPQKFVFLYKETGAPITEKQEHRYKTVECLITDTKTGMQTLLIK